MKKNSATKTLHVRELQNYIKNVKLDLPIYIHSAYNKYRIKGLLETDGYIILETGEVDNDEYP